MVKGRPAIVITALRDGWSILTGKVKFTTPLPVRVMPPAMLIHDGTPAVTPQGQELPVMTLTDTLPAVPDTVMEGIEREKGQRTEGTKFAVMLRGADRVMVCGFAVLVKSP